MSFDLRDIALHNVTKLCKVSGRGYFWATPLDNTANVDLELLLKSLANIFLPKNTIILSLCSLLLEALHNYTAKNNYLVHHFSNVLQVILLATSSFWRLKQQKRL